MYTILSSRCGPLLEKARKQITTQSNIMGKNSAIAQAALGIGTSFLGDAQQYLFQGMYNDMQQANTQDNMRLQSKLALQNWEATGPKAQMRQYKEAGLNPALMYGMGGGGGQSAVMPSAQGPGGYASKSDTAGMGLQLLQGQLLNAQKENIEADTANKLADVGVKNLDAQLKTLDVKIKDATMTDAIDLVFHAANKMASDATIAQTQNEVQGATVTQQIDKIKAEAATALINKAIAENQNKLTEEQITKIKQDVQNSIQEIKLKGKQVDNDTLRAKFDTELMNKLAPGLLNGLLKILTISK